MDTRCLGGTGCVRLLLTEPESYYVRRVFCRCMAMRCQDPEYGNALRCVGRQLSSLTDVIQLKMVTDPLHSISYRTSGRTNLEFLYIQTVQANLNLKKILQYQISSNQQKILHSIPKNIHILEVNTFIFCYLTVTSIFRPG